MPANAGEDYDKKDFEDALNKYHKVLRGSTSKACKLEALERMEIIASVKSLPEIKKYCQRLDPVMWDYQEPDQDLVEAADRVYNAIKGKLAEIE